MESLVECSLGLLRSKWLAAPVGGDSVFVKAFGQEFVDVERAVNAVLKCNFVFVERVFEVVVYHCCEGCWCR